MRVALDSNILLYAELEPDSGKGRRAADLIDRAAGDGVIATQVLGEFLRVVQRRAPASFAGALRQADLYRAVFLTPATTDDAMAAAGALALAEGLQLWDALICTVSARQGAELLLTEDMQDGRTFAGVRLVNPFIPANLPLLDRHLLPSP